MRLVSYNIHKGIGGRDRRYRLARIIEVVEEQNPDLICLQEVDRHVRRSRFDDQPKLLREYFHAAADLYQLNVSRSKGGYGNLVLSRWAMSTHHHVSLRYATKKPRGAQLAVIKTPEGPLHLVHVHLGLAERERHWQVAHLLRHRLFLESAALPTLVTGDFNDWRNTLSGGDLGKHDFAHITAPPSRFRSFPAYWPVGSLDKAFYKGPVVVRHARLAHGAVARAASDHLPLVIDFHVDNGAVSS